MVFKVNRNWKSEELRILDYVIIVFKLNKNILEPRMIKSLYTWTVFCGKDLITLKFYQDFATSLFTIY